MKPRHLVPEKKQKTKKTLNTCSSCVPTLVVTWQFFRATGAESGGKHRCPPQAMCNPSTIGNACFSCSSPWGLNWSAPKRIEVSLFFFLSLNIQQQLSQNLELFLTGVRDDARMLKAECVPCSMGEREKTRPINVRFLEISDISWRCNLFAGATVSSNRNTVGRLEWKWRRLVCVQRLEMETKGCGAPVCAHRRRGKVEK